MNKKIISFVMAISVLISVSFTSVYADSTSDKAKIHQIQTQRKDIENKVESMNNQRETVMSKINSNESNISITQKYIKQTKINIEKAEDDIKAEQSVFDKRMRVMYINGSSNYINIVLGSKGISDFMSRVENIKIIVEFDQNVINNMKIKEEAINLKKIALETGNTKLLALRDDNKKKLAILTKQKATQNTLISELNAQEKKYGAQLIIAQAAELRKATAAKVALAKREEASRQALKTAEKAIPTTPQTSTVAINNETGDLDLLARLITAEAGGESYKAQVAVGAVVLNRVKSSSFPSSISDVISEKTNGVYQFTPVLNGNINRPAQASAVKAAKAALSGIDPTNNALFFYSGGTPEGLTLPQPVSIKIDDLTFIFML
ncbi:cell wall hydrolase [Clostridium sp.]|uniref:cell wall hydrolase n=1 Tax=Clostridium sp. TaxID=1506 RepID=UPI003D6D2C92